MTPCVERLSRLKPSESSKSFMRLLMTEGVVRSSAAALVKLRRWATRTNVLSLFRSLSAAVNDMSLILSRLDAGFSSRSRASSSGRARTEKQLFQDSTYRESPCGASMAHAVADAAADARASHVRKPMLKEYHYDHLIRWPRGERAAVFLTFDFQGGEDVKPDKNGILNYEMWSQGEYG